MTPAIGPNWRLTVRGRRFVPAHGLAQYSAGVSECGCLTSQNAALGLRRDGVGIMLKPSPLRERTRGPGLDVSLDWVCAGCFFELQSG